MIGYKEIVSKNKMEIKLIRYFIHKTKQISYYNYEKDLPKILNYINFLKENYFNNITYNSNISKPKVSFIASVYNKEKYLGPFISSIQKQDLEEFELIFVDDCSTDKSIDIIGEFKEKDNRIKLIKNKKNMGSLYTRYNGALFSQGDYIIFVDSDDLVLKSGIINTYNHMKKKN
jgi:cellulose synthase/poly-beta-1,6-N-acetylglucosamine synthase-like glycosyltransferase